MKYEKIKLEYSPEWKGPVKERVSTDKRSLAIFAVFMLCWIAVACYAFSAGTMKKLSASQTEKVEKALDPAILTSPVVLGLIAGSAVMCLLCIFLLRWIAVPLVCLSIILWIAITVFLAIVSYNRFTDEYNSAWLALSIVFALKTGLIILVAVVRREKILLACQLIKEASKAVTTIKSSLFFPLFPWLLHLIALTFQLSVAMHLSGIESLGTWPFRLLFGINIMGFIWLHCFIAAFEEVTLAGTFATWYWTFDKSDVPSHTVATCTWRTMRYHLGTVALGSLLVTICHAIHRILRLFRCGRENSLCCSLARTIFCCVANALSFVEEFVKFMNRNAYINCAIYGKGLLSSASDAMSLVVRNTLKIVIHHEVVALVLGTIKFIIVLLMIILAWTICANTYTDEEHLWFPIVFIAGGSYIVATAFFGAYEVAAATIFLCFLEDCERNDGSESRPYYMSCHLRNVLLKETETPFVLV